MVPVVSHAPTWGSGVAVYLTAVILALQRLDAEMWLGDDPP